LISWIAFNTNFAIKVKEKLVEFQAIRLFNQKRVKEKYMIKQCTTKWQKLKLQSSPCSSN
jgi:hypothetical protein